MNFQKEKDTANHWHTGARIDHPFDHQAPEEPQKPKKFNFREWAADHMIGEGFIPKRSRK